MCCQKAGLIGSQAELIGSLKLGNVLVFVQLIVGPLIIGELVPNRQLLNCPFGSLCNVGVQECNSLFSLLFLAALFFFSFFMTSVVGLSLSIGTTPNFPRGKVTTELGGKWELLDCIGIGGPGRHATACLNKFRIRAAGSKEFKFISFMYDAHRF